MSNNGVTARHSSATNEHYTPLAIVDASRNLMGGIDLDPASCFEANETVLAQRIYTQADNGFGRHWFGRTFLNPPGGRCDAEGVSVTSLRRPDARGRMVSVWTCTPGVACAHQHTGVQSSQKSWWFKLANEWAKGRVESAVFVSFSVELEQTTQVNACGPLPLQFPKCSPRNRIAYRKPGGKVGGQPPHSSSIIWLPPKGMHFPPIRDQFSRAFGHIGYCVPWFDAVRDVVVAA